MIYASQRRQIYALFDLHGLDRGAGWEPYDMYDVAHGSWVGCVLIIYKSCTYYNETTGT